MHWQYLILKGFSLLLCALPYKLVVWLGSGVGFLHYTLGHSQRRRACRQLQERLKLSPGCAAEVARKMYKQIGQTVLEILYTPAMTEQQLARRVTIENVHYLRAACAEGNGVVLLTGHFGNWEWMGARLALAGFPMAAIAQGQPNSGLDRLLNENRIRMGLEPFARGNALTAALKALRRGKVLGFLADQDGRKDGIFVDFFGVLSSTPRGPAVFAVHSGAPILPAFIIRHGRGHRILLHPPLAPDQAENAEEAMRKLTAQMTTIMEQRIREHPDHWWWFQRRWLTPPLRGEKQTHD